MKHLIPTLLVTLGLLMSPMTLLAQEAETAPPPEEGVVEAAESPITAVLSAYRIEMTTDADGNRVESRVEAATASPGDILEYTATYTNVSEAPMVGLIVNGPVPSGTEYLEESQMVTVAAVFEVLIEGEEWQELPAYKTVTDEAGVETRVEADASDYQQLRWRLEEGLEPDTAVETIYRVQVNS